MNLKNYTSSVSVLNSISNIEHRLAITGASHIAKIYEENGTGRPIGMIFQIKINGICMSFKLPAKADICYKVMWENIRKPRPGTKENVRAQADRTAWKILSDWIDIQISMIQLEQAEAMEVFLPYWYDIKEDKTLFQKIKDNNFKLLEAKV